MFYQGLRYGGPHFPCVKIWLCISGHNTCLKNNMALILPLDSSLDPLDQLLKDMVFVTACMYNYLLIRQRLTLQCEAIYATRPVESLPHQRSVISKAFY